MASCSGGVLNHPPSMRFRLKLIRNELRVALLDFEANANPIRAEKISVLVRLNLSAAFNRSFATKHNVTRL
jgi:hypothetical protein